MKVNEGSSGLEGCLWRLVTEGKADDLAPTWYPQIAPQKILRQIHISGLTAPTNHPLPLKASKDDEGKKHYAKKHRFETTTAQKRLFLSGSVQGLMSRYRTHKMTYLMESVKAFQIILDFLWRLPFTGTTKSITKTEYCNSSQYSKLCFEKRKASQSPG